MCTACVLPVHCLGFWPRGASGGEPGGWSSHRQQAAAQRVPPPRAASASGDAPAASLIGLLLVDGLAARRQRAHQTPLPGGAAPRYPSAAATVPRFRRQMGRLGTWGDELTLRGICEALAVVVNVISSGAVALDGRCLPAACWRLLPGWWAVSLAGLWLLGPPCGGSSKAPNRLVSPLAALFPPRLHAWSARTQPALLPPPLQTARTGSCGTSRAPRGPSTRYS